jgi:hypothetical protein
MSSQERLALDLGILAAVIAAANPAMTGLLLHEWIGFVLVVPALIHLIVNWEWVVKMVSGALAKARAASVLNLTVDVGLFASLIAVTLSGILVIPGLAASLGVSASPVWHIVHLWSSNLTIAFTLTHFALHWQWMARVAGRMLQPAPVPGRAIVGGPPMAGAPLPVRQYSSAPAERR